MSFKGTAVHRCTAKKTLQKNAPMSLSIENTTMISTAVCVTISAIQFLRKTYARTGLRRSKQRMSTSIGDEGHPRYRLQSITVAIAKGRSNNGQYSKRHKRLAKIVDETEEGNGDALKRAGRSWVR